MRGSTKEKILTCLCILVQDVVEDPQTMARCQNWARRWREDEADACGIHSQMYDMFQRHVMGIGGAVCVGNYGRNHRTDRGEETATGSTASNQSGLIRFARTIPYNLPF